MKKLAIFDLDGTLIDTIADLAGATNYALQCIQYIGYTRIGLAKVCIVYIIIRYKPKISDRRKGYVF